MDRLKRGAILVQLIRELRENGSWCGETHLQKGTYLLQALTKVPLGLEFILYKHGPFSFDLRDELTGLRADEVLALQPQWPYGPRIVLTEQSNYIRRLYSRTLERYQNKISFVAEKLGGRDVADLERLATAYFISERLGGASIEERANELTKVKPHIPMELAKVAVQTVDRIAEEARYQVH